jgi:hypothetical protein
MGFGEVKIRQRLLRIWVVIDAEWLSIVSGHQGGGNPCQFGVIKPTNIYTFYIFILLL